MDADILAKLAISIARKIGAVIFLLPEDITQVRARLVNLPLVHDLQQILTFVGSLMAVKV